MGAPTTPGFYGVTSADGRFAVVEVGLSDEVIGYTDDDAPTAAITARDAVDTLFTGYARRHPEMGGTSPFRRTLDARGRERVTCWTDAPRWVRRAARKAVHVARHARIVLGVYP